MREVRGMLKLSNGTQLEYVAVSLARHRSGNRINTGWGGVFRSSSNVPVEMLASNRLVLENGESDKITVDYVSPTAEGSLAIFHGIGSSDEADGEDFPLEAA